MHHTQTCAHKLMCVFVWLSCRKDQKKDSGRDDLVLPAYAIAMSGGYKDDADTGSTFWYTGQGGQKKGKQVGVPHFAVLCCAILRCGVLLWCEAGCNVTWTLPSTVSQIWQTVTKRQPDVLSYVMLCCTVPCRVALCTNSYHATRTHGFAALPQPVVACKVSRKAQEYGASLTLLCCAGPCHVVLCWAVP